MSASKSSNAVEKTTDETEKATDKSNISPAKADKANTDKPWLFQKNDPRRWKAGRTPSKDGRTKREIYDSEILAALRKVKSHVSGAIITAARICEDENAKDSDRLTAAKLLISEYRTLLEAGYDTEDSESSGTEVNQPSAPVFSLTMVKAEE